MALPGSPKSGPSSSKDDLAPARRDQSNSAAKWYPGAWLAISRHSKAEPVTEVARESISVAKNVVPNAEFSSSLFPESPRTSRHPSLQLTRKDCTSVRSLPVTATPTCVNIGSNGSSYTPEGAPQVSELIRQPTKTDDSKENIQTTLTSELAKEVDRSCVKGPENEPSTTIDESTRVEAGGAQSYETSGWFSWLYRNSTSVNSTPNNSAAAENSAQPVVEQLLQAAPDEGARVLEVKQDLGAPSTSQKRSWFQMWSGNLERPKGAESSKADLSPSGLTDLSGDMADGPAASDVQISDASTNNALQPNRVNNRSLGWSFWPKQTSQKDEVSTKPQETLTVDVPVEHHPPQKQAKHVLEAEQEIGIASKDSVKLRKASDNDQVSALPGAPLPSGTPEPLRAPPLSSKVDETPASKELQKALSNQVLPRFKDTFAFQEQQSLLQRLGSYLHYTKEPKHNHVHRIKDPPHITNALAIGVHGYFPAPLIRSVLGQPTGTSVKFSTMAANAIRRWTMDHGYRCNIEKIALEGEGRISERVELLWKLLLNWMELIRKADFILIASHSQGVPVAIMLVAKLIEFGCLNAMRVGICAMAGVNLGPFPDYKSRWISGSAGELFDFALPFSQVSRSYEAALRCALNFGVRISYVGSIDDQLVSLESSLFSPVVHPYIYRAVFVDGRVHASSFLSHLVGFTLKLRNLGLSDHCLIRELSSPLAGSLYAGEGHSRLYDDENVYYVAVEFALETSTVSNASLDVLRAKAPSTPNPYILPFAMRGILEEDHVKRELRSETMELLKQFDDWKPSTKVLKDVKFRLEGIRSKL